MSVRACVCARVPVQMSTYQPYCDLHDSLLVYVIECLFFSIFASRVYRVHFSFRFVSFLFFRRCFISVACLYLSYFGMCLFPYFRASTVQQPSSPRLNRTMPRSLFLQMVCMYIDHVSNKQYYVLPCYAMCSSAMHIFMHGTYLCMYMNLILTHKRQAYVISIAVFKTEKVLSSRAHMHVLAFMIKQFFTLLSVFLIINMHMCRSQLR